MPEICPTFQASITAILEGINQDIADNLNTPLSSLGITCPTGTLNSIDLSCLSIPQLSGSGSESSDGILLCSYSYNISLGNFNNLMEFTIDTVEYDSSSIDDGTTYKYGFTAQYYGSPVVNFSVNASETTNLCPIPGTSTTICGPCCSDPFESCFYNWTCDCTTTTTPPGYCPATVNFSDTGSVTLSGCTLSGSITFSITCQQPETNSLTQVITIPVQSAPYDGNFYIYGISFDNLELSFTTFDVSVSGNLPATFGIVDQPWIENLLTTYVMPDVQNALNSYFANIVIQISVS